MQATTRSVNWLNLVQRFGRNGVQMPHARFVNGVCPIRDMLQATLGDSGELRFVENEKGVMVYFFSDDDDNDPSPHDSPEMAIVKTARKIYGEFKARSVRLPNGAVLMPAA